MTAVPLVPLAEPIRHGSRRSRGTWRNELLFLTMAGIEILWWTPWMIPLLPGANALRGSQIGAFVAGHFLTALILTRVLIRLRASEEILRAAFLIGLIGALWLTLHYVLPPDTLGAQPPAFAQGKLFFPPVLLITGFVIWFWLRGQTLAQATITPARAGFGLRIGILMLIGAALIPDARAHRAVLPILPPFFFCGLLSLSLARAASFRLTREMQRSPFGPGWIGIVALVGGIISLIGFGAAFLFGGTSFQAIIDAFGVLFGGLLQLIATVFINLFGAIFERAGQLLGAILNAVGDHVPTIVLNGPLADPLH